MVDGAERRWLVSVSLERFLPSRRLLVFGRDGPSPGEAVRPMRLGPPPAQIPACAANALGSCLGSIRRIAVRARGEAHGQGGSSGSDSAPCAPTAPAPSGSDA